MKVTKAIALLCFVEQNVNVCTKGHACCKVRKHRDSYLVACLI